MPKKMPRFDRAMDGHAKMALGVVHAGEMARANGPWSVRREWTKTRLEALYEIAYLRIFCAWESFQENVFLRSLCGYASKAGQETLNGMAHFRKVEDADLALRKWASGKKKTRDYLLWHGPDAVIVRCQAFIKSGTPGCPATQEYITASYKQRLIEFAAVRHRIAHDQRDSMNKFNIASAAISGRTYPKARPGKLLRDWDKSGPAPRRWLLSMADELISLASQMV
jgi:hypothetical protein